jgi:general stress protein YciG
MPKRSSKPSSDPNVAAYEAVQRLTGGKPTPKRRKKKDPAAVALGRRGGLKGGKARAANLTPEQLSEIGRKGAAARWGK